MTQNTCHKEKCLMWELFDKKCPNHFINMFWPEGKIDEFIEIEDCAPIRTMLMIKELHTRTLAVQKDVEIFRDKIKEDIKPVLDFISLIKKRVENQSVKKIQTEESEEGRDIHQE